MRITIFELALLATAAALALTLLSRGSHPAARRVLRASWKLTPGVVNPAVTPATLRSTVCRKGWTATVRPPTTYTNDLKRGRCGLAACAARRPHTRRII